MYSLTFAFALCCHSNATRAPIANPPNSAQLGGSLYHAPKLHPGPCSISVGVRPRTDTHRDRQTHRRAWPQYILRRLRLTQNVTVYWKWRNICATEQNWTERGSSAVWTATNTYTHTYTCTTDRPIHRVKWRHISVVAIRSPFCRSTRRTVCS